MKKATKKRSINKTDTDYAMTRKNIKKAKRQYRKALRAEAKEEEKDYGTD